MSIALRAPVAAFFAAERKQDLEHVFTIEGGKISSLEIR